MIGKLRALRGLAQASRQGSDPQLGWLALQACADFCLDPGNFDQFAGWAARRPSASPYGWSDAESLRTDVLSGKAIMEASAQLMPLVMSRLKDMAKEPPE